MSQSRPESREEQQGEDEADDDQPRQDPYESAHHALAQDQAITNAITNASMSQPPARILIFLLCVFDLDSLPVDEFPSRNLNVTWFSGFASPA